MSSKGGAGVRRPGILARPGVVGSPAFVSTAPRILPSDRVAGVGDPVGIALRPRIGRVRAASDAHQAWSTRVARVRAHFGHREHSDRSIVNTWIGDRERSEATPGVQASS